MNCRCCSCRDGICRCWYCGFCVLPFFWLITCLILAIALNYAIMHTIENGGSGIEEHIINWSLVAAALFILLIIQLTCILVQFENKLDLCRCLMCFLVMLAFMAIILIAGTLLWELFISGALGGGGDKGKPSGSGAGREGSGAPSDGSASGASGAPASDTSGSNDAKPADKGKDAGYASKKAKRETDSGSSSDKGSAPKEKPPDAAAPASDKGSSSAEGKSGSENSPAAASGGSGSGSSESAHHGLPIPLSSKVIKLISTGVLLTILIFTIHVYIYYSHIFSGSEEIQNGCVDPGDPQPGPAAPAPYSPRSLRPSKYQSQRNRPTDRAHAKKLSHIKIYYMNM